jgi:hypothetical protein
VGKSYKIPKILPIPAISALAKNFPKVANFWKVDLRFMAILLEKCPKY